jgi:hypothetical protein
MKTKLNLQMFDWNKSIWRWVYENLPGCKWVFAIFQKKIMAMFLEPGESTKELDPEH